MLLASWLTGAGAGSAAAGGATLTIRLVEASNQGKGLGKGLGDVGALLQDNLKFNTFRLVDSKSLPLPARGAAQLAGGFTARCSGDQKNLAVTIERGGKAVLQSTVELQRGAPLILGGLPVEGAKMIVILLVR